MGAQVSAARLQPYYLDVTHPNAHKGTVATTLSKLLGTTGRDRRATRLCHAKAKNASKIAPMPTGATRKPRDMSLTTTINGSIPAGG
jgi:hypothetical protein